MTRTAWDIFPLLQDDVDEISALEKENPSPWALNQLLAELQNEAGWQFTAKETGTGRIAGYIFGSSAAGQAEILRIAVRQTDRRQGVAAALMHHVLSWVKKDACECFLEVRHSNLAAIALYEKFGFVRSGIRKKYYADTEEDAIIMKKGDLG